MADKLGFEREILSRIVYSLARPRMRNVFVLPDCFYFEWFDIETRTKIKLRLICKSGDIYFISPGVQVAVVESYFHGTD